MARQVIDKSDWQEIDPATLPASIKAAYGEYVTARKLAADKREAFEAAAAKAMKIAAGKKAVWGYNFGKLSIAIVADTGKKGASAKAIAFGAVHA